MAGKRNNNSCAIDPLSVLNTALAGLRDSAERFAIRHVHNADNQAAHEIVRLMRRSRDLEDHLQAQKQRFQELRKASEFLIRQIDESVKNIDDMLCMEAENE